MSFCNSLTIHATNRTNKKKIMRRRTVFGIIFIVAGLLKLADMWNIVHLEWLWQQPWTTYFGVGLIIYIGIHSLHITASNFFGGVSIKN